VTVSGGTADVLGTRVEVLEGSVSGSGTALVRPESVSVAADPSGRATVTSVAFLGPVSRVHLTLDGADLIAQMSSSRAKGLAAGDRVRVEVEPSPVLVV
jgi:putative spermidine/putrescine transport system ATP-binding protein